jgi:hypothetical protein
MLTNVLSILANAAFLVVLNLDLFTDRYVLPGEIRKIKHLSAIDRLAICDRRELLHFQLAAAIVSVILSVVLLFGVKNSTVRVVRLISTVCSAVLFVIIMIVAGSTHGKY